LLTKVVLKKIFELHVLSLAGSEHPDDG